MLDVRRDKTEARGEKQHTSSNKPGGVYTAGAESNSGRHAALRPCPTPKPTTLKAYLDHAILAVDHPLGRCLCHSHILSRLSSSTQSGHQSIHPSIHPSTHTHTHTQVSRLASARIRRLSEAAQAAAAVVVAVGVGMEEAAARAT